MYSAQHPQTKNELPVVEIAKHVHLEDKLDSYVSDLSHGERKQLELGLVLVASPRLLLLDEPAAGLSAKERITMVNLQAAAA